MGMTLRDLVLQTPGESVPIGTELFLRALLASSSFIPNREPTVDPERLSGAPCMGRTDGLKWLVIYTDPEAALTHPGAQSQYGVETRVLMGMAAADGMGVMLATGYGAPYYEMPPENVVGMLGWGEQNAIWDKQDAAPGT